MTARIYVGTYAKYNNGSTYGAWLNLEDYCDRDSFLDTCRELHKGETDPELMFQDYEGFPRSFYSESHVPAELWEWLELNDDDRELLEVYQEHVDESGTIDQAQDAYAGQYDSASHWAEEWLSECEVIPEHLAGYIDYAAYARDSGMIFARESGTVWVFHR